jgi:hypothetical protein
MHAEHAAPTPSIQDTSAQKSTGNKRSIVSTTTTNSKLKGGTTNLALSISNTTANTDPFVGKAVAFACNSPVGQELISEFGKQWTPNGICYHLDPIRGQIVGTVMRRSRGIGSQTKEGFEKYDVVWEFTALGETSVLFHHLLVGHITAQKLLKASEEMKPSISTNQIVMGNITLSDDEECMRVSNIYSMLGSSKKSIKLLTMYHMLYRNFS